MLSIEGLAEVAQAMQLPEVLSEWTGANLAMQGIPNLTLLPPSTRIFFPGDAVLVLDAENMPCPGEAIQQHYPDVPKLVQRFPKAAMHKRGVVAAAAKGDVQLLKAEVTRNTTLFTFCCHVSCCDGIGFCLSSSIGS